MTQLYGKTASERDVEKIMACRDIVKTIMDHGVTQMQIIKIIQLLAMELEDRAVANKVYDAMKEECTLSMNPDGQNKSKLIVR